MEIKYIRDVHAAYMQLTSYQDTEDFQMQMVKNNDIEELLNVTVRSVNNEIRYLYNISSMISMEEMFENRQIDSEFLMSLIKIIEGAVKAVEGYLLDIDAIYLTPNMIYGTVEGNKWKLCYYSEKETDFEADIKNLFEYIIRKVKHSDIKAVTVAYGIYKRICEENFNPKNLFEIEEIEENGDFEVKVEKAPIESILPEMETEEEESVDRTKLYFVYGTAGIIAIIGLYFFIGIWNSSIRIMGAGASVYIGLFIMLLAGSFFGGRWFLENKQDFIRIIEKKVSIPYENRNVRVITPREKEQDNKTVLLMPDKLEIGHYICWNNNADKYNINNHTTIIGSGKDKVDCCILGEGISRIHAKITKEDEHYYIKDMNSTNGTKVNDRLLDCFELCEIKSKDVITIGNTECVFM